MKKNVMALSIAAMIGGLGFAGAASAAVISGTNVTGAPLATGLMKSDADGLELSEGGVGHMLLVPYFTAQNGNMTVLHVVNTDVDNGKAVKVRFRGAANSDDILDFQVYLSPGDVWTAAVTAGSDGIAQIVTADNTCTVPALAKGVPQSFITTRLNQKLTAEQQANHTREGYVEIFNIADIPEAKVYTDGAAAPLFNAYSKLRTLTKHAANGMAPCSTFASADWKALEAIAIEDYTGKEAAAAALGFNTPSGGLMGDWYIINVPQTTTFSGATTAVRATATTPTVAGKSFGNFVHFPQMEGTVAGIDNFTADPLFRTAGALNAAGVAPAAALPALAAGNYDLPDLSTPYLGGAAVAQTPLTQAATLTAALAVQSVTNQYATDASITAKTDWVFSMPTRRYSVAANYAILNDAANTKGAAHDDYRLFTDLGTVDWFRPIVGGVAGNTLVDSNGNICVKVDGQKFYDREELTHTAPAGSSVFSPAKPGTPTVLSLCGEVSVLAFKDAGASVLGASDTLARQTIAASAVYENGWGVVSTANGGPGLPLLGSAFIKLSNPNVGTGVSGTYGITWPHRFTK